MSKSTASDDIVFVVIFFGVRDSFKYRDHSYDNVQDVLRKKFSDVYVYFDGDVEYDEQLFQEEIKAFYLYNEVGKLSEFARKVNEKPKSKRWFFKNEA